MNLMSKILVAFSIALTGCQGSEDSSNTTQSVGSPGAGTELSLTTLTDSPSQLVSISNATLSGSRNRLNRNVTLDVVARISHASSCSVPGALYLNFNDIRFVEGIEMPGPLCTEETIDRFYGFNARFHVLGLPEGNTVRIGSQVFSIALDEVYDTVVLCDASDANNCLSSEDRGSTATSAPLSLPVYQLMQQSFSTETVVLGSQAASPGVVLSLQYELLTGPKCRPAGLYLEGDDIFTPVGTREGSCDISEKFRSNIYVKGNSIDFASTSYDLLPASNGGFTLEQVEAFIP